MDYKELEQAMADLDEDTVLDMMKEVMDNNGEGVKDALEACQKGMAAVGSLFEKGEYFVGDLIYAGEIMVEAWISSNRHWLARITKNWVV